VALEKEDCWESVLPIPVELEEWMAAFHMYADESGKLGGKSDYTSFCGYVAHISEWQRFGLEWNNCRFRWGVPPVHMSRIMFPESKDDAWKQIKEKWGLEWEGKRDLMLQDFAATVQSAQVVCIGAVVDARHFRSLPDSIFKTTAKDPLFLSFQRLIMQGIEKTEVVDSHSPISIVIDDDEQHSMGCYQWLNELKRDVRFQKVKDRVHSICFVNDVDYPGIQASDMIAYESRRFMVEKMKDPSAEPSTLLQFLTMHGIHQPQLITPTVLDELQESMQLESGSNETK
jgi:hypothetical protein